MKSSKYMQQKISWLPYEGKAHLQETESLGKFVSLIEIQVLLGSKKARWKLMHYTFSLNEASVISHLEIILG